MFGARHQPQLLWLAGRSEVPEAIVYRHDGIAILVDNQQRPWADLADDVHRSHTIHVNVCSEIGDANRYGRKWERGKMNEVFEAGSDDVRRVTEP